MYKPFKKSKSVSKHLEQLMVHFPKNDILLTRFCCSVKGKKSLEDMNVYKYMASFIASTNDALYKEIQNALSKLYIAASLSIASMLLLLTFVVQLYSYDYEYDEEFISYVMLVIFFALCIIVLQLLKRKCRMELLEAIERNYYVLTQCNIVTGSSAVKEDKVNVEIG